MAVTLESCRRIRQMCAARCGGGGDRVDFFAVDESAALPIMALVTRNTSGGQLCTGNSRGLFVVSGCRRRGTSCTNICNLSCLADSSGPDALLLHV